MIDPSFHGLSRLRILINYKVDARVAAELLPAPFRPKLQRGFALAGVCLIRLERLRPRFVPELFGVASENAAHRIAVEWTDANGGVHEGVFIPRRDTGSWINALAGGRVFAGEHRRARFDVSDDGERVEIHARSNDGELLIDVSGRRAAALSKGSCFASLEEARHFFETGSCGYSPTKARCRFEGVRLITPEFRIEPFEVDVARSSWFADSKRFPAGSVDFDSAFVMRDLAHGWEFIPPLVAGAEGQRLSVESVENVAWSSQRPSHHSACRAIPSK
jgi:hypothetical protein